MDFDPTLLRAFVAVKETGGFTRAAERLNLTQSAISHQIRKLEEQVGRPLLHRTTRRLTVTEDGEDFLRYAQQILDTLDAMTRRFQPSPISGVVRFGVPDNFMGDRLPPLLSQFARGFPAVRMEVCVSMHIDLRAAIRAGELDLAVVMSPPDCVEGTRLRRTQLVWAAAETFEAPKGASLPLAFFPKPCVNRQVAGSALDLASVDWHVVFTSASTQGIRAAVLAGLAVTVLTREEVEPGMKIVDGRYGLPPLPSVDFSLIWSANGKTPCACRFGQLILEMPGSPEFEALPLRA
ncbi:LysR family transcriptional regulator [Variovorax sp. KBW07]|uniref:LysR family transcriptional regulator n=1 Tax=Variovorax sp. KBW07 TaxID=2153358 RepID=UPI000F57719A|nr:LysR family transcriptional regulator [Variovorax sp. KBW07]RQO54861.1 LysR family transcriptional regulator [Variovorax sp. KBW07]